MAGRQSRGAVVAEFAAGYNLIEAGTAVGDLHSGAADGCTLGVHDGTLEASSVSLAEGDLCQNETGQDSQNAPWCAKSNHCHTPLESSLPTDSPPCASLDPQAERSR